MKKYVAFLLVLLMLLALAACGGKSGGETASGSGGTGSQGGGTASPSLAEGKWPAAIYSQYGIDEIETNGRIVYTELYDEGSYQYEVFYDGVTQAEFQAWAQKLLDKGFRLENWAKDRLTATWEYDVMFYPPQERSPYRMRVSFDFGSGMSFEYYGEPNPAFVITEETDDYGDTYSYINYDLSISLNPVDTQEVVEGSLDTIGLKAEELKGVANVRKIALSEGSSMSSGGFSFYADHETTEEEFNACRDKLLDALAAKGARFTVLEEAISPEEIKERDIHAYSFTLGEKSYMLMLNPDSEWGDLGGYYGFILSAVN